MLSVLLRKRVRRPVQDMLKSRSLLQASGAQFDWDLWMTM